MTRAEAGFTLIEVLVALVVAGLLIPILLNGAVDSHRRRQAADDKRLAVLVAHGLAEEAGVGLFRDGVRQGRDQRLRWQVAERLVAARPQSPYGLVAIEVAVESPGGVRLVDGATYRLKRLAP